MLQVQAFWSDGDRSNVFDSTFSPNRKRNTIRPGMLLNEAYVKGLVLAGLTLTGPHVKLDGVAFRQRAESFYLRLVNEIIQRVLAPDESKLLFRFEQFDYALHLFDIPFLFCCASKMLPARPRE